MAITITVNIKVFDMSILYASAKVQMQLIIDTNVLPTVSSFKVVMRNSLSRHFCKIC